MGSYSSWFEELYESYHKALRRLAMRILKGDLQAAEDIVHDAYLLLLLRFEREPKDGSAKGWLYKTTRYLALNERRAAHRLYEQSLEDWLIPGAEMPATLEEALPLQLSPENRQLLIWHYEQGLTHEQISMLLGISVASCRTRMYRARARCKRLMTDGKPNGSKPHNDLTDA